MLNKILKTLMATSLSVLLSAFMAFANDGSHAGHKHNHDDHKAHEGHHEHHAEEESHVHHGDVHEKADGLTVKQAWTRATVKTAKVGGGYLVVENKGKEADRLIGANVDFAERAEIHEMKLVDDVMRMRPLPEGVEIPASGSITLKPGAEHVMFLGLKHQLHEGDVLDVVLTFEKAGDIAVQFKVNALAAKEHGEHEHEHKHSH